VKGQLTKPSVAAHLFGWGRSGWRPEPTRQRCRAGRRVRQTEDGGLERGSRGRTGAVAGRREVHDSEAALLARGERQMCSWNGRGCLKSRRWGEREGRDADTAEQSDCPFLLRSKVPFNVAKNTFFFLRVSSSTPEIVSQSLQPAQLLCSALDPALCRPAHDCDTRRQQPG
jgi:hypothetical protein